MRLVALAAASILGILAVLAPSSTIAAQDQDARARAVIDGWYALVLELVRHTPTYSPPVASRAFAYLGITAWEATAATNPALTSLAGQLQGLEPAADLPQGPLDLAVTLDAALSIVLPSLFANTGPTGQRAMTRTAARSASVSAADLDPALLGSSRAAGVAIANNVLNWSEEDGGAIVVNMGFPETWPAPLQPGSWVPTSLIRQQQTPLLPHWGTNRPFAMPTSDACALPPPPPFSTEPGSPFFAEAMATYTAVMTLTPETEAIARFWSDDPMLSPTPPGHWVTIARIALDMTNADATTRADVLARLGIVMADAMIGCWQSKYEFDLMRPVTYIRSHIDPAFDPLLITPPFPEYPSGHSTLSGAAAGVLTGLFGEPFAFADTTHVDDGLGARAFPDFRSAAQEAGLSRLYGGIHFPAAITRGLEQGACIATYASGLVTRP